MPITEGNLPEKGGGADGKRKAEARAEGRPPDPRSSDLMFGASWTS